jgi:hypothetical protein
LWTTNLQQPPSSNGRSENAALRKRCNQTRKDDNNIALMSQCQRTRVTVMVMAMALDKGKVMRKRAGEARMNRLIT